MLPSIQPVSTMMEAKEVSAEKMAPESVVTRLRFRGTFYTTLVLITFSSASSASMVMVIVCSSEARKA